MTLSKNTKTALAIFAASVLLLCIIWAFTRGRNTERNRICDFLAQYGYQATEDDLLFAYDERDTSIGKALDIADEAELNRLIDASKAGGFPSDTEKIGGVTLILAHFGEDTVYMYMLDGEFELCFVQTNSGEIKKLGSIIIDN